MRALLRGRRFRRLLSLDSGPRRSVTGLAISYPAQDRPVMTFMAGVPGAGKTYSLNQLFGLSSVEMIDLDTVMEEHPHYDPRRPEKLYENKMAYEWANKRIESRFVEVVKNPSLAGPHTCLDGTGTNIERQVRRMWMAKREGFWVCKLYVRVSLDCAIRRNSRRQRRVPRHILEDYVHSIDDAVNSIVGEKGLVDQFIVFDNEQDDGKSAQMRWSDHYDEVWRKSTTREHGLEFGDSR